MPQFWIEDFAPQLFWLVISFAILYLLMARIALPRIADVLDQRQNRIASDLDKAQELAQDAEKTQAQYEAALAEARAQAQAVLAERAAKSAAEAERRSAEISDRFSREANEAAARIAASKSQALVEVKRLAAELAGDTVAKLIGLRIPVSEAEGAVDMAFRGGE